jgi:phospholipase/carboxylesterase
VTELLPCFEVEPATPPDGTVLWLHGLGASGHDFEDVVPLLQRPATRFVFPHAPQRAVTINMGLIMPAWYDIRGLGGRADEDARGIADSARRIEALVERERERGVPPGRLVLAGFSQGGAMALHVGHRYPGRLLGILALSAYELLPATHAAEAAAANATTPVLLCHGTRDPVVPLTAGRAARDAFASPGRDVRWREYPMEHQMCLPEIDSIREWLAERFASLASADAG